MFKLCNSGKILRKIHKLKAPAFWRSSSIKPGRDIQNKTQWKKWTKTRIRKYLYFAKQNLKPRQYKYIKQQFNILKDREESWCRGSRAIWLQDNDDNTKFFHKFAKGRKVSNTICHMPKEDGNLATSFN